jgi:acetolactate decarboxylase
MKRIFLFTIFVLFIAALVGAKEAGPSFNLRYYGDFKKMIRGNNPEGSVELEQALSGPHVYAVGIIENAEGEITVIDSEVWVNYGRDGISKTVSRLKKGEKASLLITANVEKWQTIVVPADMPENELRAFILEQAKKSGLNIKAPFPFLIEGKIKKLVWDVLDGTDPESAKKTNQFFFRKLVGYREEAPVVLLGFYPAETRGEFDYPGELWHIHVLFKDDNNTGHVNVFSITKGSKLEIPVR